MWRGGPAKPTAHVKAESGHEPLQCRRIFYKIKQHAIMEVAGAASRVEMRVGMAATWGVPVGQMLGGKFPTRFSSTPGHHVLVDAEQMPALQERIPQG